MFETQPSQTACPTPKASCCYRGSHSLDYDEDDAAAIAFIVKVGLFALLVVWLLVLVGVIL